MIQKLQVNRAIAVIPRDNTNIPAPCNGTVTGQSDVSGASELVDATMDFNAAGVKVGDIIFNSTDSTSAHVVGVRDDTLMLDANIFAGAGDDYTIYTSPGKDGCLLYIGGDGDLTVITAGGDEVTYVGLLAGSWLPVQIKRVLEATTATNILAHW